MGKMGKTIYTDKRGAEYKDGDIVENRGYEHIIGRIQSWPVANMVNPGTIQIIDRDSETHSVSFTSDNKLIDIRLFY